MISKEESQALKKLEEIIYNEFTIVNDIDSNNWRKQKKSMITIKDNHIKKILIRAEYPCDSCINELQEILAGEAGVSVQDVRNTHDLDYHELMHETCCDKGLQVVPSIFKHFTALEELYLIDANEFWEKKTPIDFSEEFKNLILLKKIFLDINVGNYQPLCELPNLESLDMQNCYVSDMENLYKFKSLKELNLSFAQWTHHFYQTLPESMSKLKNLKFLNLSSCKLEKLPSSFGDLIGLETLILGNNSLYYLPSSFGNLKSLVTLDLYRNRLETLPDSFSNLTSLRKVKFKYNKLHEFKKLRDILKNLKNLKDIDISAGIRPDTYQGLTWKRRGLIKEEGIDSLNILFDSGKEEWIPRSAISSDYLLSKQINQEFVINLKEYCKNKYTKLYEKIKKLDIHDLLAIKSITFSLTKTDSIQIAPSKFRNIRKKSILITDPYDEYVGQCNLYTLKNYPVKLKDIDSFKDMITSLISKNILKTVETNNIEEIKFAAIKDEDRYHDVEGIRDIIREILFEMTNIEIWR